MAAMTSSPCPGLASSSREGKYCLWPLLLCMTSTLESLVKKVQWCTSADRSNCLPLRDRLAAPCVLLEGAHFLTRERGREVNQLILHVLRHGARLHSERHCYLDINPMAPSVVPQRSKADVPPRSPGQESDLSCASPLDLAQLPSPSPSPPVSRVSSRTFLIAAA